MKSWRKKPSIPQEIIFDIFSWLPVKSLMRFRCISNSFNSLIFESDFMDIYQCHSSTQTKLIARGSDVRDVFYTIEQNEDGKSCFFHIEDCFDGIYDDDFWDCVNGIFCFWSPLRQPAVIYNPSRREKLSLPCISNPFPCDYSLGFEPDEKIYKVLFTRMEDSKIARNWIFTLGREESWKEIESIPKFYRLLGVCINGVIYMLNGFYDKQNIVGFDVKAESFRTIILWKALHKNKCNYDLIEVKGKLAVLENTMINGEINLWTLGKGQPDEGWERDIIIGFPIAPKEVKHPNEKLFWSLTYDKGIIFLVKVKRDKFSCFFYDVTRKSWRGCELQGFSEEHMFGGIYSWVESLLPLKKNCNAHPQI